MFVLVFTGISILTLSVYGLVQVCQRPRPIRKDYWIAGSFASVLLFLEVAIVLLYPEVLKQFQHVELLVLQSLTTAAKFFFFALLGRKLSRDLGFAWSSFEPGGKGLSISSVGILLFFTALLVAASCGFLAWMKPTLGPFSKVYPEMLGESWSATAAATLGMIEIAVYEELVFRGAFTLLIFRLVSERYRHRYLIASLIATALWTFLHRGVLDPNWVKFVQILPLGFLCAWLMRRFGIEHAILAHSLFNVTFVFLDLGIPDFSGSLG